MAVARNPAVIRAIFMNTPWLTEAYARRPTISPRLPGFVNGDTEKGISLNSTVNYME
jgi:hypothetical protein